MIYLYRALFMPLLLLSLPYYLRRMYKRGGYSKDFKHRLGNIDGVPEKKSGVKRIWIQAVSVGEIRAIGPLLQKISKDESLEVILTTTTSTGYKIACDEYADLAVKIAVFPLDFYFFTRKAWKKIQPDLVVLMEGELWPEHINHAHARGIPVFLVNARMSDRSFRRYSKFGLIASWLLGLVDTVYAATEQDKERLVKLGSNPEKSVCSGSLKFDVDIQPVLNADEKRKLLEELGFIHGDNKETIVLLGSSTWPGEEAVLLLAFEEAMNAGHDCRLLLVPRHAERRNEIVALLETQNRKWCLRSKNEKAENIFIHVADTTGELCKLTQAADIALIGKSLEPNHGGQTPIEAAALGVPMVYGPNMNNFRQISASLEAADAAIKTANAKAARETILDLIKDSDRRKSMSKSGEAWHAKNRGATDRTFEELKKLLGA